MVTAAIADDNVRAIVRKQVLTGVDPMHQEIEIDTLGRQRFVAGNLCATADRRVRSRRIVAQNAVFGLIAQPAVER